MPPPFDPQHSLFTALSRGREKPVRPQSYAFILRRFLAPEEYVHLALVGNGWTWVDDPILLVTDRRVLRLQQDVFFTPFRTRYEIAAADVAGASIKPGWFFGTVTIHSRRGRRHRMLYDTEATARAFVDSLNRMITQPGSPSPWTRPAR